MIQIGKIVLYLGCFLSCTALATPVIKVGSKSFTESYVLAEIISQILEDTGEFQVDRKFGMGGTGFLFKALENNEIDLYPEYTGTISDAILKNPRFSTISLIREALDTQGLIISESLGFNNTYALAVREELAERYSLKKISDLNFHPQIKTVFSYEFLKREDGYLGLKRIYNLKLKHVRGMEHSLVYTALEKKEVDLTDIYSTDAKLSQLKLKILQDNKSFFPTYYAVILAQKNFIEKHPKAWSALKKLEGSISEKKMIELNAMADLEKKSFPEIAATFLGKSSPTPVKIWQELKTRTRQHVFLVFVSLLAATLAGIPLGILASRSKILGQIILLFSGLLQTIPSLALLCFLIPLFGIGTLPSLVALFLYGLLPIVRNTYTGILSIDNKLIEVSKALGFSSWQKLRLVELPLASRNIMAGLHTSAVISVGTATLAALIGAGGYGALIVTGLALNNTNLILQGAIPAAIMALLVHGIFELLNKVIIPEGIR